MLKGTRPFAQIHVWISSNPPVDFAKSSRGFSQVLVPSPASLLAGIGKKQCIFGKNEGKNLPIILMIIAFP